MYLLQKGLKEAKGRDYYGNQSCLITMVTNRVPWTQAVFFVTREEKDLSASRLGLELLRVVL